MQTFEHFILVFKMTTSSQQHEFIMSEEEEGALKQMVTAREAVTEAYLKDMIDTLPVPCYASAVELARIWKEEAKKRIGNLSITLSHRIDPILKLLLDQKMDKAMARSFVKVDTIDENLADLVQRYRKCFNMWVDASEHVSFKATNTRLLGNVNVKDVYILTFLHFAPVTAASLTTFCNWAL